jgi:hypothetical protein
VSTGIYDAESREEYQQKCLPDPVEHISNELSTLILPTYLCFVDKCLQRILEILLILGCCFEHLTSHLNSICVWVVPLRSNLDKFFSLNWTETWDLRCLELYHYFRLGWMFVPHVCRKSKSERFGRRRWCERTSEFYHMSVAGLIVPSSNSLVSNGSSHAAKRAYSRISRWSSSSACAIEVISSPANSGSSPLP